MLAVFFRILAIFLVFAVGFLVRRRGSVDDPFIRQLSVLLMTVFYPCLIVHTLVRNLALAELRRLWMLPTGAGAIMLLGWALGALVLRLVPGGTAPRRRTVHFLCLMNNYSFLPLMLAASLWGGRGEALVVFSTLGPEVVVWTLGLQTLSGHRLGWRTLQRLLSMPMLAIALSLSLLVLETWLPGSPLPARTSLPGSLARQFGETLLYTCGLAGQATIPVSAVIAGMRMGSMRPHHLSPAPMAGIIALRLVAIPAVAIGLLWLLPLPVEVRGLLVVVATMPAALVSVPMAEVYQGDPEFAAAAVLATHTACLATIPVWLALCGIAPTV